MDHIDATLALPNLILPVAPATLQGALPRAPHMPSVAPIPSNSDGQAIQTPNLKERWLDAVTRARAATSPIERREWTEHAISLTELITDAATVCDCGVAYNAQTGQCDECIARREQLTEDHRRFGVMALDVDPIAGF